MFKNIAISALLGATGIGSWFSSDFSFTRVKRKTAHVHSAALQKFESEFVYPFSDTEEFSIKHGLNGNYFSFFKGLGKPYYYIAMAKNTKRVAKQIDGKSVIVEQKAGEIAAAICAVLREMPTRRGKKIDAWYICDLKVNKKYQGEHLPLLMTKAVAFWRFMQCQRGFAICMNPPEGDPKAASIFKQHSPYKDIDTQILNLYTLTAEQVHQQSVAIKAMLMRHGYMKKSQQLVFASTSGMKDYEIVNKTTKKAHPWQLLHIQPGLAGQQDPLQPDATYMICAVDGTALDNDFKKAFGSPSSTAQILSYGMKNVDFNCLTSNQI